MKRDTSDDYTTPPSNLSILSFERLLDELPRAERYLPAYEAHSFLLFSHDNPLDRALLEILDLPRSERHGSLTALERRFKCDRQTIYRHRNALEHALNKAKWAYLMTHLIMHNKWDVKDKLEKKLREIN